MIVIKNHGGREEFNIDKIRASLIASSDEAGCPLTESDLNSILNELCRMVENMEEVRTWHIYVMIVGLLYAFGMFELLSHYTGYSSNAWKCYRTAW